MFPATIVEAMERPDSWKIVKLVFWRNSDAEPRALALTSVMSEWYASSVLMLDERDPPPDLEWTSVGRYQKYMLPASLSDAHKFVAETLGRQENRDPKQ